MIREIKLEPISPNRWLTKQLKHSQLFKHKKIHEIMLGINPEIFKPISKKDMMSIKLKYHLPINKKIIFFGASSLNEMRKGFSYLIKAYL